MRSIGVAIVSFNTRDLLAACLESLQKCSLLLHIVVVDNASADGSAELVRTCFPQVALIEAERNLGFAAATNLAIGALRREHPTLEYVLLLNPDTVVLEGAIETLVAFLDAHPRVGIVAPRLLNPDGTLQPAAFRFPTLMMTLLDLFPPGEVLPGRLYHSWWNGRYPQEQSGNAPFPIDHPLGACMLVRCAAIDQVGLLDEGYFMYAEEVDWCYRVRRAGWAIWQAPAARVVHVGGAATGQFRARMLVELYASRLRFFRKHYGDHAARLHRAIIHAGMLRLMLCTWRDYAMRIIERDELRSRLWAYGRVLHL
ncbi:MAG: glycosyltransferase family 2 protein [Roseiflexus sp.]|nr:glycosyltransferase family 2 protein [Roseiflexus sp.]MDW8145291.1 glycosyltransferase family 2 protein [Roseiflexaceae bacterium]MDW8232048.1 glycosyltransferase family 2 protein [Roseiflexaceae bacterium]